MNATILDNRDDGNGRCFLCRISLEDYVANLPKAYQEYDIQREIVNNVYLDHLVDTVVAKRHIPPIVLVVDKKEFRQQGADLRISTFKILDGLQRTFRLKAIRATVELCLGLTSSVDYIEWNKFKLSREFSAGLREINSNVEVFRTLLAVKQSQGDAGLLACFRENKQWFEVWTGLSPQDEIRMMLTLNAGHKPVKTRHQLELLFLNLLPILRMGEGAKFTLVREKEVTSTQFSKKRQVGEFHFASIITSLLSLHEKKPVTPSTGLIQQIQSNDSGIEEYSEFTTPDFLTEFVAFLVRTDRLLADQYPNIGVLWMGREVTLAGLFGALGAHANESDTTLTSAMRKFSDLLKSKSKVLNLEQFEAQRNHLDLSKVNIGAVNRSAIFEAVKDLLAESQPKRVVWETYFKGAAR
jgi:hypothetical protein